MPDSIRETIVKAVVEQFNVPSTKPATATRSRTSAYGGSELPAFVIYPVEEDPERAGPNVSLRKLRLRVESVVQGEPPVDAILDPLLNYAVQRMYAIYDTLAALGVRGISEVHVAWVMEPGAYELGLAYTDFEITYTSKVTDPTQGGL